MSRHYRVSFEVHNLKTPEEHETAEEVLMDWFEDAEYKAYHSDKPDSLFTYGFNYLGGGTSEAEANDLIKSAIHEKLPDAKVNTYWQMIEEYDHEFEEWTE